MLLRVLARGRAFLYVLGVAACLSTRLRSQGRPRLLSRCRTQTSRARRIAARSQHTARTLGCAICAALLLGFVTPAFAQDAIRGVAPDFQVAGGVGFGLDDKIDNNFLGRLRVGALYAFEPYWIAGGFTLDVGALEDIAIGGEIEGSEMNGWYANLGLTYSRGERVTGHVGAGFMIFGLEYQHAFDQEAPHDALLFAVRFPLGFWWFTSGRERRPFAPPSTPTQAPQSPPRPLTPAAASGDPSHRPRPVGPTTGDATPEATAAPAADPQTRARIERGEHALEEATIAALRGDYAAQSEALSRAYAAQADPLLLLRIADADSARGERARAAEALQRFLASAANADSPSVLSEVPNAQAKLRDLQAQLARVRLELTAVEGDAQITIDDVAQPALGLGYDVWVDPGKHVFRVRRPGRPAIEQPFEAHAGELVRLQLGAAPTPDR